jgi:hypothetical protein
MVIPLSREFPPDEYAAVSRLVAEVIGMDFFDDSTYEPERLKYWPSTPSDGEYIIKISMALYSIQTHNLSKLSDCTTAHSGLPSSRPVRSKIQRSIRQQQDPLEKDGVGRRFLSLLIRLKM